MNAKAKNELKHNQSKKKKWINFNQEREGRNMDDLGKKKNVWPR